MNNSYDAQSFKMVIKLYWAYFKSVKFLNQEKSDFFDIFDFYKIQRRTVFLRNFCLAQVFRDVAENNLRTYALSTNAIS